MRHVSFNIGPSEVSEAVRRDLVEFATSDYLSESHRGPFLQGVLKGAIANLRSALRVPADYAVLFQPSATACMEVILRNTVAARSFHFVDGAFSARMASTAELVGIGTTTHDTPWDRTPDTVNPEIDDVVEFISLAHCETSTGQMWPWANIRSLREAYPEPLLAIDTTSTFGSMTMDWTLADFWFCSVQKCLGLPAGLGVLLASPRALERARALGDARTAVTWQDLLGMVERLEIGETMETPNAIAIGLLERQLGRWDIDTIEADTHAKAVLVRQGLPDEAFLIEDPDWRSLTAHSMRVDDPAAVKARALEAGYVIGSGYGDLKKTHIRIGTFPSVTVDQVGEVMQIIRGD